MTTMLHVVEIAQERRGADERLDVLGVADVARVHDDEAVVEPLLAGPVVRRRLRRDPAGVDPVLDHAHALGRRSLLLQALAHRLADRHDPVCPAEVGLDHQPQEADEERILEPLQLDGDLGEDVLGDDDKRDAEPARHDEADVADHRRVGQREDDVGTLEGERAQDRVREVGGVVDRAQMELGPVEGRRRGPAAPGRRASHSSVGSSSCSFTRPVTTVTS